MNNYYFTFGSLEQFPLHNGYIVITAKDLIQAIAIFRAVYPDFHKGTLNCSDYYTEPEWEYEKPSMKYLGSIRLEYQGLTKWEVENNE